jgi:hypothetical protein
MSVAYFGGLKLSPKSGALRLGSEGIGNEGRGGGIWRLGTARLRFGSLIATVGILMSVAYFGGLKLRPKLGTLRLGSEGIGSEGRGGGIWRLGKVGIGACNCSWNKTLVTPEESVAFPMIPMT